MSAKHEAIEISIGLAGADEAVAKLDALTGAAKAAARAFSELRAAMDGVESNVTVTVNPSTQGDLILDDIGAPVQAGLL